MLLYTHVGSSVDPAVPTAPDHVEDGPVCRLDVLDVGAEDPATGAARAQAAEQRQRPHPGDPASAQRAGHS